MIQHGVVWGVGLRPQHYAGWRERTELPVLEVMADNYMDHRGGPALYHLEALAARARMVIHGIGLNVGSVWGVDEIYVRRLRQLAERVKAESVSDHLAFTRSPGHSSFDLLPLPRTKVTLDLIVRNVRWVQDLLGMPLALENVFSYVEYEGNSFSEMEFLSEICHRTGAGILLDVNNLYVNGYNHHFDPSMELGRTDFSRVRSLHVSGHTHRGSFLHDTHDEKVVAPVWDLLAEALCHVNGVPVILERDDDAVTIRDLEEEMEHADRYFDSLGGVRPTGTTSGGVPELRAE